MSAHRSRKRKPNTDSGASARGVGQSLPGNVRSSMERRFGEDLSSVRIHDNPTAGQTSRMMGAKAYAVGESVAFAPGHYQPNSTQGQQLLSHEVTHVLQQRRGGAPPGVAQETEASKASATKGPVSIRAGSAPGIARSIDHWQDSTPNLRSYGYSRLVKERDELVEWLGRQTQSSIESARFQEALTEIEGELRRRRRNRRRAQRPNRNRARRRRQATDPQNSGEEQPADAPRILRQRSSVQYDETADVDDEVDRIMTTLEQPDLDRSDRQILELELGNLQPQFDDGRTTAAGQRQTQRITRVFETLDDSAVAQLTNVTRQLQQLVPDPTQPGALIAYHQGERVVIPEQAVEHMRAEIGRAFRNGARRTEALRQNGYDRYQAQVDINEDQWIVAGIAGWLGDATDPRAAMNSKSLQVDRSLELMRAALDAGSYGESARHIIAAETNARRIERAGRMFSERHIHGAMRAQIALEFTRDLSFAIVAGLAGGLAAGAIYAAAGTGVGAASLALGGGTLVGAGTRGSLELGTSTIGESYLALTDPRHDFDFGYVGERTWSGVKSGAIDGFVGGAGALAAPGLTNVIANRFFGGPAATLSSGRALGANALSAAALGVPSGVVGTGLDRVDDWWSDRISLGQFGSEMAFSGMMGGALGFGLSPLPVNGLYRTGGLRQQFRPGAEVTTPRWMMEGIGHSPFQLSPDFVPNANPFQIRSTLSQRYGFTPEGPGFAHFNSLTADQLPPLVDGAIWVPLNGQWHPMAPSGQFGTPYTLHAQGPSYNFVAGQRGAPQRLLQSNTQTRNPTYSNPSGRTEMGIQHFREIDGAGSTTARHQPGHNTALADNPDPVIHPLAGTGEHPLGTRPDGSPVETLNQSVTNYSPEPYSSVASNGRNISDWGQHLRRQLEAAIRAQGGSYRQQNAPSTTGRVAQGTRSRDANTGRTPVEVPDSIVFIETNPSGQAVNAWRINFQNPPTARTLGALQNAPLIGASNAPIVRIPLSSLSVPPVGATVRVHIPVGTAGAYINETVNAVRDAQKRPVDQ